MYGVRIMIDGEVADLKMFEALPAAQERFNRGSEQAYEGYFDSIAIFSVPGAVDVRDAASAIRNGEKDRIELVEMQESRDIRIAKLLPKLSFEL